MVDTPTAFRPSSLRRVVSLSWYEERALNEALCPPCRYLCGLCLLLALPSWLLCFAQLWPVLAAFDGPVLVDGAIRWLPLGLELGFNGTALSLRPERAAYRAWAAEAEAEVEAEADVEAEAEVEVEAEAQADAEARQAASAAERVAEHRNTHAHLTGEAEGAEGAEGGAAARAARRAGAELIPEGAEDAEVVEGAEGAAGAEGAEEHGDASTFVCWEDGGGGDGDWCADAEMAPLRLGFSQLLYDGAPYPTLPYPTLPYLPTSATSLRPLPP